MRIKLLILLMLFVVSVSAQNTSTSSGQNSEDTEGFFRNLSQQNSSMDFTMPKNSQEDGDRTRDRFLNQTALDDSLAALGDTMKITPDTFNIYGRSFLQNQLLDYTSESALVPPPNYRIGPGDEIAINIWDGPQEQQVYVVDRDGSIFPQFLGKIYVQGLTFENLQSMLKSRYLTIVPAGSKIDVQLVKVRTVRVNVVGEVMKPNAYSISAFATALNVIAKAGGITEIGSMRDIEVKRNGYTIYTLDIYEFLANGGAVDANVYLENNDYIVVPVHKKTIRAAGDFKRPMFYQLRQDENLQALLKYSGGLKANSRKTSANLTRFGYEQKELISVPIGLYLEDEFVDFVLQDMDSIFVDTMSGDITNTVTINGAVKYPDEFELLEGETLYDLINKAGGLREDAYLKRVLLQRGDSINLSNTFNLNLENFDQNSPDNIQLEYGDVINIFSNADFYTEKYVEIFGAVHLPSRYRYTGQLSVKDLIMMAGGLTQNAELQSIEISRIYDTVGAMDYIKTKPNQIYTIDIFPDLESDTNSEAFKLKPFDIVTIKSNQRFEVQDVVKIEGEIVYPGPYTLTKGNQRLSDVIKRAGGLTTYAELSNASLYRDTLGKFYCDFVRAVKNPGSRWDVILNNKDSIYVPDRKTFVTIEGAVLEPMSTFVNPDFTSVKDYISLAGGFSDLADSKKMYIQYRDGSFAKPKTFLFFKFYPSIENGGIIKVPQIDPNSPSFLKRFGDTADKAWDRTSRMLTTLSAFASTAMTSVLTYLSLTNG